MASNKPQNVPQKVQQTGQKVQDVKQGTKDAVNAVKNIYAGNKVQGVKDGLKALKNKAFRKHIIIVGIAGALIPILILLLIAGFFMTIINRNRRCSNKFCI